MKTRVILEENDILELISEKYGVDTEDINVNIECSTDDWGTRHYNLEFEFESQKKTKNKGRA